jgi:hypothetical protein
MVVILLAVGLPKVVATTPQEEPHSLEISSAIRMMAFRSVNHHHIILRVILLLALILRAMVVSLPAEIRLLPDQPSRTFLLTFLFTSFRICQSSVM